ncbi:hypothetical protein CsSME_00017500 [Camellia sinensis var. sinensis]
MPVLSLSSSKNLQCQLANTRKWLLPFFQTNISIIFWHYRLFYPLIIGSETRVQLILNKEESVFKMVLTHVNMRQSGKAALSPKTYG